MRCIIARPLPRAPLNSPNPALVSRREAQPLPRVALLLVCAAYVLPGLFGRDPWKSADITAFGYIVDIAQGKTSWFAPTVGGLPTDGALLPYWIGAVFVKLTTPWLDPAFAARIPFAALLALALALTWYATYHFARSESAQPLPFAFGGEAKPIDYARAIADGAALALIASLGLLQLGHETTPELAQLAAIALFLYGVAAITLRPRSGPLATVLALPALAASGAPSIAVLLAVVGIVVAWRSQIPAKRRLIVSLGVGGALSALVATALGAWADRLGDLHGAGLAFGLVRLLTWFAWPAWILALWTVWQWRYRLLSEHLAMPLACTAALLAAWVAMAGSDRALMLVLPPLAVLAAFALPTLQRSASAAIDWFSVFFFSIAAIAGWLFYVAIQTGEPAKLAGNVARLSPGYVSHFSGVALAIAVAGTLAWLWLVRWRAGRNRHPLWKSLVLPAGGVVLCLVLAMSLLLAPLDNARGYRSLVQRIARQVPSGACVAAPGMERAQVVALEYLGNYRVDAVTPATQTTCDFLLLSRAPPAPGGPWRFVVRERRNRGDVDVIDVYRRVAAPA